MCSGTDRRRDRERQLRGAERRARREAHHDSAGLMLDLCQVAYLDSSGIELLFDLARRLRTHRQRLKSWPTDAP